MRTLIGAADPDEPQRPPSVTWTGGTSTTSTVGQGVVWVGEHGPELVRLSAGATVVVWNRGEGGSR